MWCGASLGEVEVPMQVLDCPVCDGALRPQEGEGWSVHICDKCTGIWMNAFMMQRLERIYEEAALQSEGSSSDQTSQQSEKPEIHFQYRRCPECCEVMLRSCYKVSGVILDECMGHGTWFDAREFEKVLSFLKAGGLQKYEKYQAEKRAEAAQPRYMKNTSFRHHHPEDVDYFGGFYNF